jgi:TRAP-type mannitol/chloroaromatic compound transport system permease small subunit
MIERIATSVDRLSGLLCWVAIAALLGLIAVTLFEVFVRYVLNAPTLWSSDIGYMLNGALFLLATAYTLRTGGHIRVDFFSARFRPRTQDAINAVFFALVLLPALSWISWVTARRTWRAFESGELDPMSSWAPLIWPFYLVLTIGFVSFALQVLAETIRHALGTSTQIRRD